MRTQVGGRLVVLSVLSVLAAAHGCAAGGSVQRGEPPRWLFAATFDEPAPPAGPPPGWTLAETAGRGQLATWAVIEGRGGGQALALVRSSNSGQTYNLAVLEGLKLHAFHATVAVKALAGEEDRGGGLCWRLQDADNYYITRWNPLEANLRLYVVVAGKRRQLASAEIVADPAAWHDLGVEVADRTIKVSFDGEVRLTHDDATLPAVGRLALWTKADAATAFDDLRVW
jgi:hypothetical protein